MSFLFGALALISFILLIVMIVRWWLGRSNRPQARAAESEGTIEASLAGMDREVREELERLERALQVRVRTGRLNLPTPNEDICVRAVIPLRAEAFRELGWKAANFIPVAEINDGDLLVVSMVERGHPVSAYFHDGGEFEVIYPVVAVAVEALQAS